MLTELENRWLNDWARPIVAVSSRHRQDCESSGGASGEPSLNSELRWPGYVGSHFESSCQRILCVAQIHSARELNRTLGHLQGSMHQWMAGKLSDEAFFRKLQESYQSAIAEWGPWTKTFTKILGPSAIDQTNIAYTNFAKCWQDPNVTRTSKLYSAMKCCEREFPIARLVRLLRAEIVVEITSDPKGNGGVRDWGVSEQDVLMLKGRGQDIGEGRRIFSEICARKRAKP